MQIFRSAAVATVILGAGLASTAGVAMANEHGGDAAKGCSNSAAAKSSNGADRTLGDTTGGTQDIGLGNTSLKFISLTFFSTSSPLYTM